MNIIDYAVQSVDSYKIEKKKLDQFLQDEIVAPCEKAGFLVKKQSNRKNLLSYPYLPEDIYNIFYNKKKVFELNVHKLESCFNDSKYIVECIVECTIPYSLYTNETAFTDLNKNEFKMGIGKIIAKYLGDN